MLDHKLSNQTGKLLIDTLLGNKSKKIPIWFMRQAGRYLPEYKKIRESTNSFLEFCYSPDKASEVTLQPIKRFDFDAAIIFSDILVIPDALGMEVRFITNEGPVLTSIKNENDVNNLEYDKTKLFPVYEAINITKTKLEKNKALIGFAGAPWTLATYMIEGGGSKDYLKTKAFSYQNKKLFTKIIDLLVNSISKHLIAQIEAGVDAVQIFDSWAGVLTHEQFKKYSIDPTAKIVSNIRKIYPNIPIIGFPKSAGVLYRQYAKETAVNAISFDQYMPASWIKENIDIPVQGNLDPVLLMTDKKGAVDSAKRLIDIMQEKAFIFNLGHGILQDTPIENVEAVVREVKNNG